LEKIASKQACFIKQTNSFVYVKKNDTGYHIALVLGPCLRRKSRLLYKTGQATISCKKQYRIFILHFLQFSSFAQPPSKCLQLFTQQEPQFFKRIFEPKLKL
jgi:hypothetical protein